MVILFTLLLVGGTIGVFYWKAASASLPENEVSFGGVSVGQPVGYQWDMPVFWGAYDRRFEESPSLSVEKLGTLTEASPALTLPDWVTKNQLTLTDESGKTVFEGSAEEYEEFAFEANGLYTAVLKIWHDMPDERPAKPQGWYQYSFRFTLNAAPQITLSKESAAQGSVVGVKLTGVLGSETPLGECDLGSIWFCRSGSEWVGYLPVAYNAEAGMHTLTVTSGGTTLTQEIEVYQKEFDRVDVSGQEEEGLPAGAAEEYRRLIWPFYSEGSLEKQWLGAFSQPVKGTTLQDYGAYLVDEDSTTRASDLILEVEAGQEVVMPSDGTILFAGELLLGGNTVVIDHGCGLKTYISGLGAIYVSQGQSLLQNEALGETGEENIVIEMRIGNKSIDPWDAWRGNGGLFYR